MPRQTFLEHGATAWGLSLHLISGQTTIIALLFILHALSLLCLFLGYHTSTAALISWCLEMSLQNRNAMVLQGGDVVCRFLHLYALFLPLNAVWSLDELIQRRRQDRSFSLNSTDEMTKTLGCWGRIQQFFLLTNPKVYVGQPPPPPQRTPQTKQKEKEEEQKTSKISKELKEQKDSAANNSKDKNSTKKSLTTSTKAKNQTNTNQTMDQTNMNLNIMDQNIDENNVVDENMGNVNVLDDNILLIEQMETILPVSYSFNGRGTIISHLGTAAMLLQIVQIYAFAGLLKSPDPSWSTKRNALSLALHTDEFTTPAGYFLRDTLPTLFQPLFQPLFGHADDSMNIDSMNKEFNPVHLQVLTVCSHWLEMLCPLLVLPPYHLLFQTGNYIKHFRFVVCLLYWSFHIGIRVTMDIGHFSLVSSVLWVLLVPPSFWNVIVGRKRTTIPVNVQKHATTFNMSQKRSQKSQSKNSFFSPEIIGLQQQQQECNITTSNNNVPTFQAKVASSAPMMVGNLSVLVRVLIGSIMYIVICENVATVDNAFQKKYLQVLGPFSSLSGLLRLEQKWNMFSTPLSEDGWYECTGTLRSTTQLDLMGWGGPVPRKLRLSKSPIKSVPHSNAYDDVNLIPRTTHGLKRPTYYSRRFASQRWRKYLMGLRSRDNHKYRLEYGRYICRIWNGPGYVKELQDEGQLLGFQLYFYQEPLVYIEDSMIGHEKILLWNHTCF